MKTFSLAESSFCFSDLAYRLFEEGRGDGALVEHVRAEIEENELVWAILVKNGGLSSYSSSLSSC